MNANEISRPGFETKESEAFQSEIDIENRNEKSSSSSSFFSLKFISILSVLILILLAFSASYFGFIPCKFSGVQWIVFNDTNFAYAIDPHSESLVVMKLYILI